MARIGNLSVDLTLGDATFTRDLNKAARDIGSFSSKSKRAFYGFDTSVGKSRKAVRGLSNDLKGLYGSLALMAGGYTLGGLGKDLIKTGIYAERMEKGMQAALGSVREAAEANTFLEQTSKRLGLVYQDQIKEYIKLAAAARGAGFDVKVLNQVYLSIVEAGTALQLNSQDVSGALYAITQMISKGKVSMEELRRQLGERLPGAFALAAASMGMTTQELDSLIQKGGLFIEDFLPRFSAHLRAHFSGALEASTKTAQANLNRLSSSYFKLKRTFSESGILEGFNSALIKINRQLTKWLDNNSDLIKQNMPGYINSTANSLTNTANAFANIAKALSQIPSVVWSVALAALAGGRVGGYIGAIGGAFAGGLGYGFAISDHKTEFEVVKRRADSLRESIEKLKQSVNAYGMDDPSKQNAIAVLEQQLKYAEDRLKKLNIKDFYPPLENNWVKLGIGDPAIHTHKNEPFIPYNPWKAKFAPKGGGAEEPGKPGDWRLPQGGARRTGEDFLDLKKISEQVVIGREIQNEMIDGMIDDYLRLENAAIDAYDNMMNEGVHAAEMIKSAHERAYWGMHSAFVDFTDAASEGFLSLKSLMADLLSNFSRMLSEKLWAPFFATGGGTGGQGGIFAQFFQKAFAFDNGGHIGERVIGVGASGRSYEFHPNETVIPDAKLGTPNEKVGGTTIINKFYVQALDVQSFENKFGGSITKVTTEALNDNNGALWGALARR